MTNHPIQPLVTDEYGTQRFKENKIVSYLLDNGGMDMTHLAKQGFSEDDLSQFAQLIGYSYYGWSMLSYVSDETYHKSQSEYNKHNN